MSIRAIKHFILCWICLVGSLDNAYSQPSDTCSNNENDLYRVLFIVDASYSMDRKWGKTTLWEVSQKLVQEFAFHIQKHYNVEMGLRVYGHNSPVSVNDCYDSKLEVPIAKMQAQKIANRMKQISYKGSTPLGYSLQQAAEDLGCNSHRNLIILITDGYESCGLDPCSIAEKLLDYRIALKPIVLGLNVTTKEMEHMKCIGDFVDVRNANEFKKELYQSFDEATKRKMLSIYLDNPAKSISDTRVPLTISDSKGRLIGHFIHSLNKQNKPDTFSIGDYDSIQITLHTLPPLTYRNIALSKHIINSLRLPTPLVDLKLVWQESNKSINLNDKVEAYIWRDTQLVYRTTIPDDVRLLRGKYRVDILTQAIDTLHIELDKESYTLKIPPAGLLALTKNYPIIGDIYRYDSKAMTKIATLNSSKSFEKFFLPPGKYKVIYRSQKAITQYGTFDRDVEIIGGTQVNLQF